MTNEELKLQEQRVDRAKTLNYQIRQIESLLLSLDRRELPISFSNKHLGIRDCGDDTCLYGLTQERYEELYTQAHNVLKTECLSKINVLKHELNHV